MATSTTGGTGRKPGRPKGGSILAGLVAGGDGPATFDPRNIPDGIGGTDDAGSSAENRGTGSGAGNGGNASKGTAPSGKKASAAVSASAIEMLLLNIHGTMALMAKAPELALSEPEAKQIATSYVAMQQHYGSIMSQKQVDTAAFLGVIATVYGSKILALSKRTKSAAKKPGEGGTVTPIRPNGGGFPGMQPQ